MYNITKSEFSRLFKSRSFFVCLAISGFIPLFNVLSKLLFLNPAMMSNTSNKSQGFQNMMFLYIGTLSAIFISLFVGREINDGTIRNKLIYGYKRIEIFLSELIVCICAVLLFQTAFTLMTIICYTVFLHGMDSYLKSTVVIHLVGIFVIIVYCTLYLVFTILSGSRTIAAVASIIMSIVLSLCGQTVYQNVYSMNSISFDPNDISPFSYASGKGTTVLINSDVFSPEGYTEFYDKYTNELNTAENAVKYYSDLTDSRRGYGMTGGKKAVLLFLCDILPSCQAEHLNIKGICLDPKYQQYMDGYLDSLSIVKLPIVPKRWTIYIIIDVLLSVLISAVGYILFSKKDIN